MNLRDFDSLENEDVTLIIHKPTGVQFRFLQVGDTLFTFTHTSIRNVNVFETIVSQEIRFDESLEWFASWIKHQVIIGIEELTMDDPFIQFTTETYKTTIDDLNSEDETSFTPTEAIKVKQSVSEFENLLLKKFALDEEFKRHIKDELKYLRGATDKLNKRDWKAVAKQVIHDLGVGISGNLILNGMTAAASAFHPIYIELVQRAFQLPLPGLDT